MPEAIEKIFKKHGRTSDELIPILQDFQRESYGVSSFYAQFRFTEPGRHGVKVCLGTACHVRGGATLLEVLERGLGISCGQTTEDKRYDLERVACLGCCALSPVVQIDRDIYSRMTVNRLTELLKEYE